MPTPRRPVTFRVKFNDALFADDLAHCRAEGRHVAQHERVQLERDGVPQNLLMTCGAEHRDGTDLPGMVKLYLPIPYGPWGLILQGATDPDGLHLAVVAFGERHPTGAPASTTSPTTAGTEPGQPRFAHADSRLLRPG